MDMYQKRKMRQEKKNKGENTIVQKNDINWYPGHMAKTKREIKENINLIDVAYEVIDARMPISSKIVDIDNLLKDKPKLLIVTKYDLCDKKRTDEILKEYASAGYHIIKTDLINENNTKEIITETLKLGNSINEKRKEKGMKPRRIRILVIGVPNVGKSTLINKLVGKKAVNVGDKPGVTKSLGWIRIHNDIELLDSPGILWPKLENQTHAFNLACLSSIKEEILNIDDLAIYILKTMNEKYPESLKTRYGIENFNIDNIEDILKQIATKRGALSKGAQPDYPKVYKLIIRDLKDGQLGKVTFD